MNVERLFSFTRCGRTDESLRITRPWDPNNKELGDVDIFARFITPAGGENLPVIVKLQGGPGYPSPRPTAPSFASWMEELLKHYRVLLLDQRGTGRSTRIDKNSPCMTQDDTKTLADRLAACRADSIVADCEAFREELGLQTWNLFGQSFGGFVAHTYASFHPDKLDRIFLTGGIPDISRGVDAVYKKTYQKVAARTELFYRRYPWTEAAVRDVCRHLDTQEEFLPTGERLTSRRFRTIGIALGRHTGPDTLAMLFEEPFHKAMGGGVSRLKSDFLATIGAMVSFEDAPLYGVNHEAIYGGTVPGATNWSAHRLRDTHPGMEENADPLDLDYPFYLTGEHIYPWQFDEDPALIPFKAAAEALAAKDDWGKLYDAKSLAQTSAIAVAAVYVDDIYVPVEFSLETAESWRDLRPFITNQYQHNGIGEDGASIVGRLVDLADSYA